MEPLTSTTRSTGMAQSIPGMETGSLSRRDVLRLAAGLGLSFALPALAGKAAATRGSERPKSLILLWMGGGPSQLETFDPHPGTAIGGTVKAIATRNPDLQIAELYPQMAEEIHSLNVIRSLVSKEGDHERGTYMLKTGYRPDPTLKHPSFGAILEHELPNEAVEIPQHISIGPAQWPGRGGFLGDDFDAFKVFDPRQNLQNLASRTSERRQNRRLANLQLLENRFALGREAQTSKTMHHQTIERALRMMTSEQLAAFKTDDEPRELREAYGDSTFGQGCLVARRLVETGVRTVEVTLNGWDSHTSNFEAHRDNAAILDPAFASLIRDLRERDLLDSTLVLWIGEFGRTPTINPAGGRDHWPTGFSCVLGGGGLASGLVIGATDPENVRKTPEDPIEIKDLSATILHTLGIEYDKELMTPIGRPMAFSDGKPVERLLRGLV